MIGLAEPFDGVLAFFETAAARGADIAVVSHKTRLPTGASRTICRAARGRLGRKDFHAAPINLPMEQGPP